MAKEAKKLEYVNLDSWEVTRVHEYRRSRKAEPVVYMDLLLNGIHVYGCRIVTNQHGGEFIAFPSHKSDKGEYYNHAYAYLSPDDQASIIDEVYKQVDDSKE